MQKISILYDDEKQIFHISNNKISYIMELKENTLLHRYWGHTLQYYTGCNCTEPVKRTFAASYNQQNPLFSLEIEPQEFSCPHQGDYREPSISVRQQNGCTIGRMKYQYYEITDTLHIPEGLPHIREMKQKAAKTLAIHFLDMVSNIKLILYYSIVEDSAVIIRSAQIINQGNQSVWIDRAFSTLIDTNYQKQQLITFYGTHQKEFRINRQEIQHGIFSIGSTRGASSPQYPPFAAICMPETTEHSGEVYAFQLIYSGNHCVSVERNQYNHLRVAMGINPEDFCWKLLPNESFQTPQAILIYSNMGLNSMSQEFHKLYTERLFPTQWAKQKRPILLNSWEMCYFDVSEQKMIDVIKQAAKIGFELVVLDDGWFGHRNNSKSSLGDWTVNTEKFPNGLTTLLKCAEENGIQFGIWFEPEMISPNSILMKSHSDWYMQMDGYTPLLSRNQLVLDLTQKEVQNYIIETLSNFIKQYPISYIKWDMNRHITDPNSLYLSQDSKGEFFHRYMLGLYHILQELTTQFPNILFENCSSGGGRFDAGMGFFMPQTWCSDNTDALDRQAIQYGASYLFPLSAITAHISAVPNHQTGRNVPFATRAAVASSANMGYELNILELSSEEKELIMTHLSEYKKEREFLFYGEFYRLCSPFTDGNCAWMIIDQEKTRAIIYYFIREYDVSALSYILKIPYVDCQKNYVEKNTNRYFTGEELIYAGIAINTIKGDFPVIILELNEKK